MNHPDYKLHLRFERTYADGAATKTPDASGNGNHGTLVNGPTLTAGRFGRGMGFVGASSQYVDTGSETVGDGLFAAADRRWTVAVWAKYTDNLAYIIARASTTNLNRTFGILSATVYGGDPAVNLRGKTTLLNLSAANNEWNHHCMTWDGANAYFYFNGRLAGACAVGTAAEETGQRVIVGARDNGLDMPLTGSVDDLLVLDRALSAEDIRRVMHGFQPLYRYTT